jgi:cystathionine beta-lyase
VVIDTPVYPPFAASIRRLGRVVAEAPLVQAPTGWALDLDAIRRQYRAGAKAHILCSPHNPTGIVYDVPTLREIANMAEQHGVLVLSDEIHAPLTHPGATHTPFPAVSEAAAARSIVLTSASKAWNLAGLKAAVLVAGGPTGRAVIAKLPPDTPFHAGHLGVLASRAAFEEGAPWLARVRAMLDRNRTLFGEWLASSLPEIGYTPPQAGYLAWLDFRRTPLGADPAQRLLEHGRVALSPGLTFGAQGAGFARLNFATTRAVLEEATVRIGATVRGRPIGSST